MIKTFHFIILNLNNSYVMRAVRPYYWHLFNSRGNLDDMAKAGSLHEFLFDLHTRFGPIASFYWGDMRVVSVSSPLGFRQLEHIFDRGRMLSCACRSKFSNSPSLLTLCTLSSLILSSTLPPVRAFIRSREHCVRERSWSS